MKMKSLKTQFIGAIAMVLVAAIAMGSSTYAWYAMNQEVTATGMNVKAKSEAGLIISNASDGSYNISATTTKASTVELLPGSSANLSTFYHSNSTNPAAANTQQAYTTAYEWDSTTHSTDASYIVHDFYIKSSAGALTVTHLDVKSVSVKVGNTGTAAQELSKSLRVGIKIAGDETASVQNTYIYAPVTGFDSSYDVAQGTGAYDSTARTAVTPLAASALSATAVTAIPAMNGTPIHAQVYVWFEGEDDACTSNNLSAALQAVLEELTVTVTFGYTA